MTDAELDTLIVGAGPTGLTLAAALRAFGARFRLVDRAVDRVHESRALGVQARSLEVLQSLGLGEALVRRGNPSVRLVLHLGVRTDQEAAQYLVRPDGHVGFRCAGRDLRAVTEYLGRWFGNGTGRGDG